MEQSLNNEVKYVSKGIVIFNIIVIALLLLTSHFSKEMLLGLIFGSLIGMLNFRLLALTIAKAVDMPVNKAQIYSASRYLIRMGIIAVVLVVAARASHISIIGVAVGLLSPKFVILAKNFLEQKLNRKEA